MRRGTTTVHCGVPYESVAANYADLTRILDAVPLLVASCDVECRYTHVNEAYAARFRKAPAELVGLTMRDIVGPDVFGAIVPLIEQRHLVSDPKDNRKLAEYRFFHMTQGDGVSAVMRLKDPGFAHPASPKDYPAAPAGIGLAREALDDVVIRFVSNSHGAHREHLRKGLARNSRERSELRHPSRLFLQGPF